MKMQEQDCQLQTIGQKVKWREAPNQAGNFCLARMGLEPIACALLYWLGCRRVTPLP